MQKLRESGECFFTLTNRGFVSVKETDAMMLATEKTAAPKHGSRKG
jgi:hypothetical protein